MSYINDLGEVVPGDDPERHIEGAEDPNWWRTREMSAEERERRIELLNHFWMRHENGLLGSSKRIVEEGGGFFSRGISGSGTNDLDWPRRAIVYIPPLPEYWSEARKKASLKMLEHIYRDIKSEIENA